MLFGKNSNQKTTFWSKYGFSVTSFQKILNIKCGHGFQTRPRSLKFGKNSYFYVYRTSKVELESKLNHPYCLNYLQLG